MPPIANAADHRPAAEGWFEGNSLVVVCLCAAWCDTCGEFRTTLEAIAEARPALRFVWLDIEDDSELCGDVEIENFPTLAIYRGRTLLHFGVSLPTREVVARLIDAMDEREGGASGAPRQVLDLPAVLGRTAGPP